MSILELIFNQGTCRTVSNSFYDVLARRNFFFLVGQGHRKNARFHYRGSQIIQNKFGKATGDATFRYKCDFHIYIVIRKVKKTRSKVWQKNRGKKIFMKIKRNKNTTS